MSAAITNKILTIAAGVGRAVVVNVTGSLFICRESSAQFVMQFNDGEQFPCESGFALRPPGGFTKLVFCNKSATEELTLEFYAGDTYVAYDYQGRVPKTRLKASAGSLFATETATFNGTDQGQRRKSILITNNDANNWAGVIDVDSATEMATVFNRSQVLIETDATVKIKHIGSSGTVAYRVAELFYV